MHSEVVPFENTVDPPVRLAFDALEALPNPRRPSPPGDVTVLGSI
jgi:hypothetical protein